MAAIAALLDHYWVATMADGEREILLDDWRVALQALPLDAVIAARRAWLSDTEHGRRAPKIAEFLAVVQRHAGASGDLGPPPAELLPRSALNLSQQSPPERWSSYARLHAFFEATGRTNPRPVDPEMRYHDAALVAQARAETVPQPIAPSSSPNPGAPEP